MKPTQDRALPNLRRVRLLILRALDELPHDGPTWHPTFVTALAVRTLLKRALQELRTFLGED